MTDRTSLILDAQRKGFHVVEHDGWWWLDVPHKPRFPANRQGAWATPERAWSVAALLAQEYPDTVG
jgi:hypothetical protein